MMPSLKHNKKPISEKAKKRILIAKDVLKLLEAKKIKPAHTYLTATSKKEITINDSMQKVLKEQKSCEVCALGSMFYAYVNRFNKVKVTKDHLYLGYKYDEYGNWMSENSSKSINSEREPIIEPLLKFFSEDQLDAIEDEFEHDNYRDLKYNTNKLKEIMENIIKNKGKFIPKEERDDEAVI